MRGPRRDTRPVCDQGQPRVDQVAAKQGASIRNQVRELARVAATGAAPQQSALSAFLSIGEDGELGVFGLRWDMAAAMLATFCASAFLHHGDMLGFLGGVGHALDRPNAGAQQVFDKVRGCYGAELTALAGGKPQPEACDAALDVVAKFRGVNVLGDGRVLTDSQMLMLSPDELGAAKARAPGGPSGFSGVFKYSGLSAGRPPGASGVVPLEAERPASEPSTDLAASYPLPLHAAWTRLANGDLTRYLRSQQCGLHDPCPGRHGDGSDRDVAHHERRRGAYSLHR